LHVIRAAWLTLRTAVFMAAVALTFLDGLSWVVLPGRFVLDLVGAAGPDAGKYAVVLSGVFYAGAALVASLQRREAEAPDVVFELAA
jgi:hypothetical protein